MASSSPLDRTGEQKPVVDKGHGTEALGPSDTSDSGSDIRGGPGMGPESGVGFDHGTTSDPDTASPAGTAGPDIGDANLDSDTDASGTGERATAGRDTPVPENRDRDVDHVEHIEPADEQQVGTPGQRSGLHKAGGSRTGQAHKGPRRHPR